MRVRGLPLKVSALIALLASLASAPARGAERPPIPVPPDLLTRAELTGFQRTETPDEILEFLTRLQRLSPYLRLSFIGPSEEGSFSFALSLDRVSVRYGSSAGLLISPADYRAFLADMANRAPQLTRRGHDLVLGYA